MVTLTVEGGTSATYPGFKTIGANETVTVAVLVDGLQSETNSRVDNGETAMVAAAVVAAFIWLNHLVPAGVKLKSRLTPPLAESSATFSAACICAVIRQQELNWQYTGTM